MPAFEYNKPEGAPIDWWKELPDFPIPRRGIVWMEHINLDGDFIINPFAGFISSIGKDITLHEACRVASGHYAGEQREIFRIMESTPLAWDMLILNLHENYRGEYLKYITHVTLLALERQDWEMLRWINSVNGLVSIRFQSDFHFYWEDMCLDHEYYVSSTFTSRIPITTEVETYLIDMLHTGGKEERWRWEDAEGNLTNESLSKVLFRRFFRRRRNERYSK